MELYGGIKNKQEKISIIDQGDDGMTLAIKFVINVIKLLAKNLANKSVVVHKLTIYSGTTEEKKLIYWSL